MSPEYENPHFSNFEIVHRSLKCYPYMILMGGGGTKSVHPLKGGGGEAQKV